MDEFVSRAQSYRYNLIDLQLLANDILVELPGGTPTCFPGWPTTIRGRANLTVFKWTALWAPLQWPHGVETRPEMDQRHGGTRPEEFASDLEKLQILFGRFVKWQGEYAPHPILGPLSKTERMRHAYLHIDHHLRQFGA